MKVPALLLSLLLTLAGCGTVAQQVAPTPTPKPAPPTLDKPTYAVERGEIIDEMKLNGRVTAVQQQDLSFEQNGFVKTVYVTRSSVITEGQLLAELDLGELPNQLRQVQIEYEQALAIKQRAESNNTINIRRAELDLEDARAQAAALREKPTQSDLAVAQAAVAQAQAALNATRTNTSAEKSRAELDLQSASQNLPLVQTEYAAALREWEALRDNQNDSDYPDVRDRHAQAEVKLREAEIAVTRAQITLGAVRQDEATAISQAEAMLSTANAQLAALNSGPRASALAEARRNIERAELNLAAAQQGSDPENEKRLATAELEVERIQQQINTGRLYAPFDGQIAALEIRPGYSVEAYKPVVRVMNPSELEVVVDITTVRDGSRLGIGMPVTMVFVRHRGQQITGTLERLPSSATSSATSVNPDTGYHIDFERGNLEFEVGDLAAVTFTLERKQDTLWLPPNAIRSFEGRRFVVVREGDRQRRKDVKIGIVSEDRVEILSGVEAGEIVVGQ